MATHSLRLSTLNVDEQAALDEMLEKFAHYECKKPPGKADPKPALAASYELEAAAHVIMVHGQTQRDACCGPLRREYVTFIARHRRQ